jgi:glutamine amidotransferase
MAGAGQGGASSAEATGSEAGERRPAVTVLDYGAGNVRSAVRALEAAGADVVLSRRESDVMDADGLVVPGVGAFDAVMKALRAVDAPRMIGRRIAGGRPVLGICVGLQVFFERGVEHGISSQGLGEWPGAVEKLPAAVTPHMGWNTVEPPEGSVLFRGIEDERFYFVHSYGVQSWDFDQSIEVMAPPKVTWSEHGARFIAAVENGPLSATQFHPEKSSEAGLRLLRNWIEALPRTGRLATGSGPARTAPGEPAPGAPQDPAPEEGTG